MLSLLEALPDGYRKKTGSIISLNELTVFSIMINENSALVGTNKKIILCTRKWLFFKTNLYYYWEEVNGANIEQNKDGNRLKISSKSTHWLVPVSKNNIYLLPDIALKINNLIKKKGCH